MRFKIIENIIFSTLVLICFALVYMQVIKGKNYFNLSLHNRIRVIPIEGPRGRILDRNGLVLADNRLAYHVGVISQDIDDLDSLFNFLGGVLNKKPSFFKNQFLGKFKTSFTPVILAKDVDQKIIMTIEESRFQYPGLVVEKTYQRYYPFAQTNAHAVGYVGKMDPQEAEVLQEYGYSPLSDVGKTGVEKTYDSVLRAQVGGRQIEVNSRGQQVRLLGFKEPSAGKDIQLTIDQRIQSTADELLGQRPGAIVVMNMDNGELLGLVSSPSFNPNAFINRDQQEKMLSYIRDSKSPLLDRALSGQYPPGSVFKIPVALAGVELKKITRDTSYDCPGFYMLGDAKFGCAHVHGRENLNDAIAHSCNVYFYHVGQILGARIIEQYAKAFGLGRVTGIDLPFEASGQVIGHAKAGYRWYTGNTLNFSIGQGDTLSTPLQLTVLSAAVANDGVILRPHVIKAMDYKDLQQPDISKLPIIRLHDETWRLIQQGMRSVITDHEGTAHLLNDLGGMSVFGKTGTAQAGGNKSNHAWFVGYLRSPKFNLAFCVFLENGGSSANAVEITHQLLSRMQLQGII